MQPSKSQKFRPKVLTNPAKGDIIIKLSRKRQSEVRAEKPTIAMGFHEAVQERVQQESHIRKFVQSSFAK